MAGSMAKIHNINETSKDKLSSMVQGNSLTIEQERITIQEAVILENYNITYALQLFGKSALTGRIELDRDIDYPIEMINRYLRITFKCKRLREKMASKAIRSNEPIISFGALTTTIKLSGLNRKMDRSIINDTLKQPPSYEVCPVQNRKSCFSQKQYI